MAFFRMLQKRIQVGRIVGTTGKDFRKIVQLEMLLVRGIVGGVDTHKDLRVAAVVDERDRVIETRSFAANPARLSPAAGLDGFFR